MFKKIFFIFLALLSIKNSFAKELEINCKGLPGCDDPTDMGVSEEIASNFIAEMIKYVAVLSVIALMISGIMYMFSHGEEEKTKKAKSWILWSLTAVVLSISSYYIVTTIVGLNINVK